jgi:DNA-binding helix-turn-helix protein
MFVLSRTVAAELRSLAARKRISKTEIARQTGLSLTTVQRSFAADRKITLDDLQMLTTALNTSAGEIVKRAEESLATAALTRGDDAA